MLDGAGATIAEREVVFGGAALVAMAFNGHANLRVVAQEVGGFSERLAGIRTNVSLVEIEIGILDILSEQRIQVGRRRRLYRRRGDADGDARWRSRNRRGRWRLSCTL